ncbi:MAG: SpoIIE family protein phosphatase [Actinomycetota bacterium]|nr:SpoIIE family protein phosphatase [Actinomycetota bacterium]
MRSPEALREARPRFVSRWVLAAIALDVVLSVIDGALGHDRILTTAYLVAPLAVALAETGERTAVVAVLSTLLAIASGVWDDYFISSTHLYRVAIVAGSGALAVIGAVLRTNALQAKDRMELLGQIAGIADGRTDIEQSLRRLADLLIPAVADFCEILVVEAGELRRCASRVARGEPEVERRLLERPVADGMRTLIAEDGPGGASRLVTRLSGEDRLALALDAEGDAAFPSLRSAIFTPVRAADRALALLVLAVGPSRRGYGAEDLRFARTVGSRAALAIQNARLVEELRDAEQRMQAIVGSLADAVTIRDRPGRIIYANRAGLESMGISSLDDLREADPESLFDRYHVTDESGAPLRMEDLPSMHLLRGEEPTPLLLHYLDLEKGEDQWRLLKTTPLYNAEGGVDAAVTIIEDVTASKRAEIQTDFLSRASEILASSLDYEETLRNVAWLAVPEISDWCVVELLDEQGLRQQVIAAHPDPQKQALAERLREFDANPRRLPEGLRQVVQTGVSALYHEIGDELLAGAARTPEHLRLLRELQMRSVLLVPMRAGARTVGGMSLVMAESGRRFTEDDLRFAEQIAARAAVAVENSRLYTRRSQIAQTLQRSLIPELLPEIPGWEIAALYRPASPEGDVEVGGDFYDAFRWEGGWMMLIGDVTGKGVQAAAMTSLVRHGARFVGELIPEPVRILERLHVALRQQPGLELCSALCVRIEDDRITFASAGHPLPMLVTDDGVRDIGTAGPVLGAFDEADWPINEVVLRPSHVLLMYTDGVTDTVGSRGRFGEHRLQQTMAECGPLAADELLNCLDKALSDFQTGPQADDTAALALRLAIQPAAAHPVAAAARGSFPIRPEEPSEP